MEEVFPSSLMAQVAESSPPEVVLFASITSPRGLSLHPDLFWNWIGSTYGRYSIFTSFFVPGIFHWLRDTINKQSL